MYLPQAFREDRLDVQHALIRAHPLGLLVSGGEQGLEANSLPFLIDSDGGRFGTLRGHLARANPQQQRLRDVADCLVVFQGPHAYISPSWYPGKAQHGKVVPTWNYASVQAWGQARMIDDPAWLLALVTRLTDTHEAARAAPWAVADAPGDFVAAQLRAIVGIEIPLTRIEGKWKVSQNRPAADQAGVAAGLADGDESARALARLVEQGGA